MTAFELLGEIAALKLRLLRFPAGLAAVRRQAAAAAQDVEAHRAALAEQKAELRLLVAGEVVAEASAREGPKTKPRFSNEAARDAEVVRRLAADPAGVDLTTRLAAAEAARVQAEIDVRQLEDEHRVAVALKDLLCREVDLLVHGR